MVATAVCVGACEPIGLRLASSVRMAECTLQGEETRMAGGHMGLRQWGRGESVEDRGVGGGRGWSWGTRHGNGSQRLPEPYQLAPRVGVVLRCQEGGESPKGGWA